MSQLDQILAFLTEADERVRAYEPDPEEKDAGRTDWFKLQVDFILQAPVDIRSALPTFKDIVRDFGVEAFIEIPNPDNPSVLFVPDIHAIPSSSRALLAELYHKGTHLIEQWEKAGETKESERADTAKRARLD